MYYILIIIATILFTIQFILSKGYQKLNGSSLYASMKFTIQTSVVCFLFMLMLGNFKLQFSWFSLGMAFLNSLNTVILSYCGNKALKTANLSVYSVFTMLGAMLLPFIYGIFFFGEPFTIGKAFCCILIAISLRLNVEKKKSNTKAFKFYIACFIFNGLSGVMAKIHQSSTMAVSSQSYIAMTNIFSFILCFIILCIYTKKLPQIHKKDFKYTVGGAVTNGVGNLLLLIALRHVDASIQYPLVTGGVIIFSAIVNFYQEKRITIKLLLSVFVAFLASLLVIL